MALLTSEVKNYNRPLKKRPVYMDPIVKVEPEQEEPVNLCVRKAQNDDFPEYISKISRTTPLKDITENNKQERVRYSPYKIEKQQQSYVDKESLYNMLPGYRANTTNTLNYSAELSPPRSEEPVSIKSEPDYWHTYSREQSLSPPSIHIAYHIPSSHIMKIASSRQSDHMVQYSHQHHHSDEYSRISPPHSHSSLNSVSGSSRSSISPESIAYDEQFHSYNNMEHSSIIKSNTPNRYQCADCSKSYSTQNGLSKHQENHCAASPNNQVKKVFKCPDCPKTYTTSGALKMHIKTHTKPCKCHMCGKAFSRPWLLQGHIRTHTGDKPFSCHHCHRAFADKSNLRAHLQTHSDVKKYSCSTCSKTFSRMSLLTKHTESGCPGRMAHHH